MLIMKAMEDKRVYRVHPLMRLPGVPDVQYDIFGVGVKNGEYLSEDYWVCEALAELDYKIYVDTAVAVNHTGMKQF